MNFSVKTSYLGKQFFNYFLLFSYYQVRNNRFAFAQMIHFQL